MEANGILFEPLSHSTWLKNINGDLTSFDKELLEEEIQLRIHLSEECWLCIVLRTHGGAC